MTIKSQGQNVSAEIDVTTLFDIEILPVDAIETGAEITSVKLTRRDFHDSIDGTGRYNNDPHPRYVDLMDIFYTEREINEKIKMHVVLYEDYEHLPQTNAKISDGKDNYIYLVPFTDTEDVKEGIYKEYIWAQITDSTKYRGGEAHHNDNIVNGIHYNYEAIGSTEIDLEWVRTHLDALDDITDAHEQSIIDLNTNKADKLQTNANAFVTTGNDKKITSRAKIGNIDIDGKLYTGSAVDKSKILTSDSSTGIIKGVENLSSLLIINSTALTNIDNSLSAGSTQSDINAKINNKFNTLYNTTLTNYLLKSEIKDEIWGTQNSGFRKLQDQDHTTTKLGDYIYSHLYNNFTDTNHLGDVALSNNYNDLDNTPTIPTDISELSDSNNILGTNIVDAPMVNGVIDGNMSGVTSNAVYDHTKDMLDEFINDLIDPSTYVIEDDSEDPVETFSMLEFIQSLTERIGDAQ